MKRFLSILLSSGLILGFTFEGGGNLYAQSVAVRGLVKANDGTPIIGASVVVSGTTNGVSTDRNGNFSIKAPADGSLSVSYIGYRNQNVSINKKTFVEIVLEPDIVGIDDVIVVAFGQQKRESFTGSAGIIKSDEIGLAQNSNPINALSGRVAGVQLNSSSGQFGESPSLTIRGVGSISSGTEPLYIVDGMPYDGNLDRINPQDIESMTVLKDAASNALYGARGANGVVMITTKKGKAGEASITVDAKWGVNSSALQSYDYIKNPKEWYETYYKGLYNKYIREEGATPESANAAANAIIADAGSYIVYTIPSGENLIGLDGKLNPNSTLGSFYEGNDGKTYWLQPDDWEDIMLKSGFRQEYNASISGASDKVNYYASFGYLDSEGITDNSHMDRFTARIKADYQARKWLRTGVNASYAKNKYDKISEGTIGSTGNIFSFIHAIGPIFPMYLRDENKQIMIDDAGQQMYDFGNTAGLNRNSFAGSNPAFFNKYNTNETEGNAFSGSAYADFNILPNLRFTFNAGMNSDEYRRNIVSDPYAESYSTTELNGSVSVSHSRRYSWNSQQILNWTPQIGQTHHFDLMVGHEYYDTKFTYLYGYRYNMSFSNNHELNGALIDGSQSSSYKSEYNNEGYFSRLMYDYDNKYYLSASFRRDASSRFAKANRWGNFWSLGAAWLINKENWFHADWVSLLKFKLSVGSQGNDNIGDFRYVDTYNMLIDGDNLPAFTFREKGSPDITWETNTNWNTGFDFELFGGRLGGSMDYFYRKTSDMLFQVSTAPEIGYASYYSNVGDMRNSGVELQLNGTVIDKKDLRLDLNFNISHVKNKILSLPAELKTLDVEGHAGYSYSDPSYVSKYKYYYGENLPLYTWYMPKYAGVNEEGLSTWYKNETDAENNPTGNIITTTEYSQADDFLCGTSLPDVYGGFGLSLYAYGFDLTANFTYQLGGKALDYNYMSSLTASSGSAGGNWHEDVAKSWTPENPTNYPRFVAGDSNQNARSNRFLASASYLNFQTLSVGYTIPEKLTRKFKVSSMRVYLSCDNVCYVSTRRGFDPRQSITGFVNAQVYSPIRTISGGVTLKF